MKKILLVVVALALSSASALVQEKGGDDRTGPYDVVANWPQPLGFAKPGYIWGSTGGIFAESADRVFIANRGELKLPATPPPGFTGFWGSFNEQATTPTPEFRNCIVVVDRNGKAIESWTQWDYLFADGRGPHSVLISPYDPAHNVWVVDDIHHQIFEFTNDGKRMLMSLGVRDEAGSDGTHFKRPTDIAWLPDGTFFISDGYGNTRVAKFDKTGKFLMSWGTRGTGNGEFNTPHSITIDKNRRVYVSDRANNRIQVFDENGKYLDQFPRITQPYHIRISDDQFLWAFSGPLDKLMKYDLNGHLLYAWGTHGTTPGLFWAVHEFSVDGEGNFYTAEVFGGRSQKFHPREGADPAHAFKPQPLVAKTVTPSATDGHAPEEKPASGANENSMSAPPIGPNVSGSWSLVSANPPPPPGPGRGAAGGGISGPYAATLLAPAPQNITISQTTREMTVQIADARAIYRKDGSTNEVPSGDVLALKTRVHVSIDGIHLHYKQGMNWGRDVLTINPDNTLKIVRDLESGGQSTTRTLTYTKTS